MILGQDLRGTFTFMWNFLVPLDQPDVIKRPDFRRESAVDAEDLVVDESCHGEHVEDSAAVAPGVGVAVLVLALVVETVNLASEKKHVPFFSLNVINRC